MAVRTTRIAVAAIIEIDGTVITSDDDMAPFIEVANSLVTDVCSDSSYTDAKLELIERWLSAHFYAIRDPRAVSEHAGPVGATFESRVDLGFNVTRYGQQAMRIDTAGGLAALDKRSSSGRAQITPSVGWAGTTDWDASA